LHAAATTDQCASNRWQTDRQILGGNVALCWPLGRHFPPLTNRRI